MLLGIVAQFYKLSLTLSIDSFVAPESSHVN